MPLLVFLCQKCGAKFEYLKLIREDTPVKHCECEGQCDGELKQIPTAARIEFKGRGFYENDYKGRK